MRLVRCVAQRPTSEGSAVAEDTDSTRDPLDPIPDVDWAMEMGDAEDGLGPISYDQASTSAEAGHTRVMPVAAPGARMDGTQPSLYRRDSPSAEHGYATASENGYAGYTGRPDARAQKPRRRPKRARHGFLSFILWLVMLACLGLMAIRCLPASYSDGRAVPELVSFVPALFVPVLACLVLAALWRRRVLLVVSAAALATIAAWHIGYFVPTSRVSSSAITSVQASASTSDNAARIMTLNTYNGNASAAEIVALVKSYNVEVLCLEELTDAEVQALSTAGLDTVLPYHVISDAASEINNGGRNGIWTAAPMSNVSTNLLPINTSSMPAADIVVGETTVRIVAVHPNSPVRGAQSEWSQGLSVIQSLSGYNHAYLLCGDFNSTWDHARFRELLGDTFVDAGEQSGQGFHMTYPSSGKVPSLIEIDHFVYSKSSGIVVSNLEAVAVSGADHRALIGILEAS
jgi:endonuclease/exonuclease/phosphatase (EEP) superfamily protein YafD